MTENDSRSDGRGAEEKGHLTGKLGGHRWVKGCRRSDIRDRPLSPHEAITAWIQLHRLPIRAFAPICGPNRCFQVQSLGSMRRTSLN